MIGLIRHLLQPEPTALQPNAPPPQCPACATRVTAMHSLHQKLEVARKELEAVRGELEAAQKEPATRTEGLRGSLLVQLEAARKAQAACDRRAAALAHKHPEIWQAFFAKGSGIKCTEVTNENTEV